MALAHPTPLPFPKSEGNDPVFQPLQQDLMVEFAEQFTMLQGKFIFCIDEAELKEQFRLLCEKSNWTKIYCDDKALAGKILTANSFDNVSECDAAVTTCEYLVARTGSIVLSSFSQGRVPSAYAPVHICIASASQLVYDIKDGLNKLKEKYGTQLPSFITFATGPSRTADIEKTLVVGVHGPKDVYCFVVDESIKL